jgi:DNA-binding LacI/PurR family transcriptional regulator
MSNSKKTSSPDATMTTINDVASLAKVAKSTVSNVLSNKKNVSDEIRKRVLDACDQLNYTPSFTASTLASKKTKIIGLFLEAEELYDGFKDFYNELIKSVVIHTAAEKYNVIIYYYVEQSELSSSAQLYKGLLDGAIFLMPQANDYRIELFNQQNIPFVVIGHPQNDNIYYSVDANNEAITFEITQHLIKKGHKKILFFNSKDGYTITQDRLSGFLNALRVYHCSEKDSLIINCDNSGLAAETYLRENIHALPYTAIIVPSDIAGARIYPILSENGYQIGKDISVFALGGTSIHNKLTPELSTSKQDYFEMGKISVQMLMDHLNGALIPPKHVRTLSVIFMCDSTEYSNKEI